MSEEKAAAADAAVPAAGGRPPAAATVGAPTVATPLAALVAGPAAALRGPAADERLVLGQQRQQLCFIYLPDSIGCLHCSYLYAVKSCWLRWLWAWRL